MFWRPSIILPAKAAPASTGDSVSLPTTAERSASSSVNSIVLISARESLSKSNTRRPVVKARTLALRAGVIRGANLMRAPA